MDKKTELEQRIAHIEGDGDSVFGQFTRADWYVCIAIAVVLPYILYIWFWP